MTDDPTPDSTQPIPHSSDPVERARQLREQVESSPRQIGAYKILQTLGEGGMGVVYLAEQAKPIHRRVALKIIKLGMDTKNVIARFETEREALALMNHPNIAKVFDAGATDSGRPYFAMEFVPGISITEYCDKHRLTTEERLSLFIDVCHAIQHAHQKGVIHRDIKPSNVLVAIQEDAPVPKVIDFGVAKATQNRLTERTIFTEQGQLIGTPGYMSPEQAEMTALDIDTRTDIYSLGVLLYELLVGSRPFDDETLLQGGFAGIKRLIREIDPPKPSTKLSGLGVDSSAVAQKRRTEVRTLARELRGDLDWIIMRCLEKDRNRRYDSSNTLALELQRYLHHQPVLAGPPTSFYRMQKFVRRNRAPVIAACIILLSLVAGMTTTTIMYFRAESARASEREQRLLAQTNEERATRGARRTKVASGFLAEILLDAAGAAGRTGDIAFLKAVADGLNAGRMNAFPDLELHVRGSVAILLNGLKSFDLALSMAGPAVQLAEAHNPPLLSQCLQMKATALCGLNRYRECEHLLLEAYELEKKEGTEPRWTLSEQLLKLYESWHIAEPGNGYDEKANLWRARVAESEPEQVLRGDTIPSEKDE